MRKSAALIMSGGFAVAAVRPIMPMLLVGNEGLKNQSSPFDDAGVFAYRSASTPKLPRFTAVDHGVMDCAFTFVKVESKHPVIMKNKNPRMRIFFLLFSDSFRFSI